jgi:hypothetical protein
MNGKIGNCRHPSPDPVGASGLAASAILQSRTAQRNASGVDRKKEKTL